MTKMISFVFAVCDFLLFLYIWEFDQLMKYYPIVRRGEYTIGMENRGLNSMLLAVAGEGGA